MRHTLGENACKDEGKDWGDVPTSLGIPEIAAKHQKLGERHGWNTFSLRAPRTNLCRFGFRLLTSGPERPYLAVKARSLWHFVTTA